MMETTNLQQSLTIQPEFIVKDDFPSLELIRKLSNNLEEQKIRYCHWKSNAALERSALGETDLDLLVGENDRARFEELLASLGFKAAYFHWLNGSPAIRDHYGYDESSGRFVHVHAHYQLVIGNDLHKNYHLPVEEAYLESVGRRGPFQVPAIEMEFIVFIIRMTIKHSTWDTLFTGHGALNARERLELAWLGAGVDHARLALIQEAIFPFLEKCSLEDCIHAFQGNCPWREKLRCGANLLRELKPFSEVSDLQDFYLKTRNWVLEFSRRRLFKRLEKKLLTNGRTLVAVVGGDGSGKTTAVREIAGWLGTNFDTRTVHLGKPPWSATTWLVRGGLKIGTLLHIYPFCRVAAERILVGDPAVFPGYPWLIREVCTARDRWLAYRKARRIASKGTLVICDRYPLPVIKTMDAPLGERMSTSIQHNWFTNMLIRLEEGYYQRIPAPDQLFVLRLAPELALRRKAEEDPGAVLVRSGEVWNLEDWGVNACLVDASHSKKVVFTEIKKRLWQGI
jgi:hypothetical protein